MGYPSHCEGLDELKRIIIQLIRNRAIPSILFFPFLLRWWNWNGSKKQETFEDLQIASLVCFCYMKLIQGCLQFFCSISSKRSEKFEIFCSQYGFAFLPVRFWIGAWTALLLFLQVMFDLSAYVAFITLFTQEAFASLVSAVFVKQTVQQLIHMEDDYEVVTDVKSVLADGPCHCNVTRGKSTFTYTNLTGLGEIPRIQYCIQIYAMVTWSTRNCGFFLEFLIWGLFGPHCGGPRPTPSAFLIKWTITWFLLFLSWK